MTVLTRAPNSTRTGLAGPIRVPQGRRQATGTVIGIAARSSALPRRYRIPIGRWCARTARGASSRLRLT